MIRNRPQSSPSTNKRLVGSKHKESGPPLKTQPFPKFHEIEPPLDWNAIKNLSAQYLLTEFQLSDYADDEQVRQRFKDHVAKGLSEAGSGAALTGRLKKQSLGRWPYTAFFMLIAEIDPMSFWPDLAPSKHPEQADWDAHRSVA